MSLFDPRQLPDSEKELTESDYGTEKIKTLISFYGCVTFDGKEGISQSDIDPEYTESEWKLFRYCMSQREQVLSVLLGTTL